MGPWRFLGGDQGVFGDMEAWNSIRQRVFRDGVSIRQIHLETGLHFKTIRKILAHSSPPEFRCPVRERPKLGLFLDRIAEVLEGDRHIPKKHRHTAKRIFEVLQAEGYEGGYTQIREAVRELKRLSQEVFMPLTHRPGEAQVDFGEALVKMAGVLRKVMFFAMALPYSDAMFIVAYPRECTETFQDGHARALAFFDGVPRRISYDNARTSVSEIIGSRTRKLTDGFLQLQSHYLFEEHFCRVRRANEKGVVEGVVKYARQNYFVPVLAVQDFEELNAYLEQRCTEDLNRTLRGKGASKKERLKEEREAFLPLPAAPFDTCRKTSTTADRLSLVRFDCNDYSVPVRFVPTIPSSSRAMSAVSISAGTIPLLPSMSACGRRRTSPSSPSITSNCSNASQAPSIMPGPWRTGNCPNALPSCASAWRPTLKPRARGSSSASCGCWKDTPKTRSPRPLARHCAYAFLGNPGTGKTHLATALGHAACAQGKRVRCFSVTGLVTQLLEAREDRQLDRLLKRIEKLHLLILDEFGYVPFSKAGAELLFEVVSRAYERQSVIMTTNLPFEQWTEILGNERLTGALLDRMTHRVHIIEANGESYRLKDAKKRVRKKK